MSYQASAPEEDAPSIICPVCLEHWNTTDHLPKFLLCHHSICVTCAGELQRTAKKKKKVPLQPSGDGSLATSLQTQQQLTLSQESLGSLNTSLNVDQETPSWVRCPMCRTRTFIEDPTLLQTNYYLRGLSQTCSVPRLVVWCETCSKVAAPECSDHSLQPVGEKMRSLQEELIRRSGTLQGHVTESLCAHKHHIEVYRWLCGLLRHSHSKVLAALTHAAQYHQALQQHNDSLQKLVEQGNALQAADAPDEVIEKLTSLLKELDIQQSAIIDEVSLPIINDTFQILRTHQAPEGFGKALVVMDADKSVTLSVFGEEERQKVSESEVDSGEESSDPQSSLRRAMSLQIGRHKRNKCRLEMSHIQKPILVKESNTDLAILKEDKQNSTEIYPANAVDGSTGVDDACFPSGASPVNTPHIFDSPELEAEVSDEEEEIIDEPETPIPKILPITPEIVTLQRDGTFGKKTVNVSYRKYPPYLYDEESATGTNTLLNIKGVPGEDDTYHRVFKTSISTENVIEVVPPVAVSHQHRSNDEKYEEDDECVFPEEPPMTSQNRGRRKKRSRQRPSHKTVKKVSEGDRHPKPRGRKQSRHRQKDPSRKSSIRKSSSMCRIA